MTTASQSGGGVPGTYRYVANWVNGGGSNYSIVYGAHLNTSASYDPSVEGEILSLNYSEDSIMVRGFGDGQFSGPAIYQNGQVFIATNQAAGTGLLRANQSTWTHQAVGGLTSANFTLLGSIFSPTWTPNGGIHPDFSATGAAMLFGFYRADSACTNCPGYDIEAGIDNWFVSVDHADGPGNNPPGDEEVPEPAAFALLSVAVTGAAWKRKPK